MPRKIQRVREMAVTTMILSDHWYRKSLKVVEVDGRDRWTR